MPNTCHRCGAVLDAHAPFCAQCGAPQIRVSTPEPEIAEGGIASLEVRQPAGSRKIDWTRAFLAVLAPAIIAAFVMLVPILNLAFFLWIGVAGAASVAIYARRKPNALIDTGVGARLGAIVGVLAFAVLSVLMAAGIALSESVGKGEYRTEFLREFHDQAARNPDPRAIEIYNRLANNPEALAVVFVVMLVFLFMIFVVAGCAGGAIAGSQRRGRSRP